MRVTRLTVHQFRNLSQLDWTPGAGRNVLVGANGQGKSNVLEALEVLSAARSSRASHERELIQHGQAAARIEARVFHERTGTEHTVSASFLLEEAGRLKVQFQRNSLPVRSRSQVLGLLPTVTFFLPDLQLLRGAPEDRRRWLDGAATQVDPRHLGLVTAYQRIRAQKSHLLRTQGDALPAEHLAVWNQQLAEAASQLLVSRLSYLDRAEARLPAAHQSLQAAGETPGLAYSTVAPTWQQTLATGARLEAADWAAQLLGDLQRVARDETRRGTCLIGPHRDDVLLTLEGQSATAYASQGQQRTLVLALKLAEFELLRDVLGERPVLLMDDVMAELDPERQRLLLGALDPEAQTWLTTTHLEDTVRAHLGDAQALTVVRIQSGALSQTTDKNVFA